MTQATRTTTALALGPHDRRRVAVKASCDPDTVSRYLEGKSLRSTTLDRIEQALRNMNLETVIQARAAAVRP